MSYTWSNKNYRKNCSHMPDIDCNIRKLQDDLNLWCDVFRWDNNTAIVIFKNLAELFPSGTSIILMDELN